VVVHRFLWARSLLGRLPLLGAPRGLGVEGGWLPRRHHSRTSRDSGWLALGGPGDRRPEPGESVCASPPHGKSPRSLQPSPVLRPRPLHRIPAVRHRLCSATLDAIQRPVSLDNYSLSYIRAAWSPGCPPVRAPRCSRCPGNPQRCLGMGRFETRRGRRSRKPFQGMGSSDPSCLRDCCSSGTRPR